MCLSTDWGVWIIDKKEIELFWVESFRKYANLEFTIKQKCESPDFIIKFESEEVGLEVSEIFVDKDRKKGSLLKAKEQFKESILNTARGKYILESLRPIRLNAIFSPDFNSYKVDSNQISQLLFKFLTKSKIQEWENIRYSESNENWGNLSKYFSSLHIIGLPYKFENYWSSIDFSFASTITKDLLIQSIIRKEKKLKAYQQKVSKNWLLLFSDGRFPSSNIDESIIEIPPIRSNFDKIFLLLYPHNIIKEIQLFKN